MRYVGADVKDTRGGPTATPLTVGNIGSGDAEYSRSRLSAEQEEKFSAAVDEWVENGWLVDQDTDKHGAPACVLLLMAVLQEQKQSTPVRPVLDYCLLNEHIVCHPGADSCLQGETSHLEEGSRGWLVQQQRHKEGVLSGQDCT